MPGAGHLGRPPEHDLLGAILYVDRTGIPWRYLSHDYLPWETGYAYFARWQKEGVFEQLNGLLRSPGPPCPPRRRVRHPSG